MLEVAKNDSRFRLVRLSRNFGHQIALTAGVDVSAGDAVIVMDADLQDPPEVVLELVERWREGYDVVYAVREARSGETRFKRLTASAFYRAFNRIAEIKVPLDVGDFRLVDRGALEVSRRCASPTASCAACSAGSVCARRRALHAPAAIRRREPLLAAHDARVCRERGGRLLAGAAAPGPEPRLRRLRCKLRLRRVELDREARRLLHVPGWTSIVVVVTFIGGIQLVVLGVIGQYIGDIHAEIKQRPLYVIGELEGFERCAVAATACGRRQPPHPQALKDPSALRAARISSPSESSPTMSSSG